MPPQAASAAATKLRALPANVNPGILRVDSVSARCLVLRDCLSSVVLEAVALLVPTSAAFRGDKTSSSFVFIAGRELALARS